MHIHIIIHHGPDEEDRLNLLIFTDDGIYAVDVVGHAKSESPKHDTRIRLRGRSGKGSDLRQINSGFGDLRRLLLVGLIWRRYKQV
ncbi:hypothetical protein MRB53_019590 [Persea americana]|uniref:Uncharacterized protein n=1 Tax=Persea americana TaxID=3435 RepID=A0ACC2KYT4_PERAE|nr:hypothetical protein MRB53_019590 [Persea americana]